GKRPIPRFSHLGSPLQSKNSAAPAEPSKPIGPQIMQFPASLDHLAMLFLAAIVAGFIDAIAGGGGVITLPALLLAQIPPVNALATNKLHGSFGTLTSSLTMLRKGKVRFADIRVLFLSSLIGSTLGAVLLLVIDPKSL